MADASRNWARVSRLWFPISALPLGGTPVLLASEDKTVQWFCEKPNKKPIKHTRHVQDEDGRLLFEDRADHSQQQHPLTETVTVEPRWWTPVVYVDDNGSPVFE